MPHTYYAIRLLIHMAGQLRFSHMPYRYYHVSILASASHYDYFSAIAGASGKADALPLLPARYTYYYVIIIVVDDDDIGYEMDEGITIHMMAMRYYALRAFTILALHIDIGDAARHITPLILLAHYCAIALRRRQLRVTPPSPPLSHQINTQNVYQYITPLLYFTDTLNGFP